jgi:hypothetical protein
VSVIQRASFNPDSTAANNALKMLNLLICTTGFNAVNKRKYFMWTDIGSGQM